MTVPSVAINDFIGGRGMSGSSRACQQITSAVEASGMQATLLTPNDEPKQRLHRVANMLDWDFRRAPAAAARARADCIVHATNTGGNRGGKMPSVLVMHDTMVLDHPGLFDRGYRTYALAAFSRSVYVASRVVVPSEHSRTRVLSRWPHAQVDVIPWYRERTEAPIERSHRHARHALIVSSTDRHKRLRIGLRGLANARTSTGRHWECTAVLRPGNEHGEVLDMIDRLDPDGEWIHVESDVPDTRLNELYERLGFLLIPSIDEGFCLPAMEATTRGMPVLHTSRGALAGLYNAPTQSLPEDDEATLFGKILDYGESKHDGLARLQWQAINETVPTFESFASMWKEVVESACAS